MKYDFRSAEEKWQRIWSEKGIFRARNGSEKKKFYALVEFPYPSGNGLHVGHARPYTAMDIIAKWYVIPLSSKASPVDTGYSFEKMTLVDQNDVWDAANKARLLERWNKEIGSAR